MSTDDIGSRIRSLRQGKKITQAKLASIAGVSSPAVTQWENGLQKPKTASLKAIAEYFGVDDEWLLTGKEDQIRAKILSRMSPVKTHQQLTDQEKQQSHWIDLYEVNFSCGEGESIAFHFDSVKKSLPFEDSFFSKRGIKPENFKLIFAQGDSNEEYIFHGDAVGLDISDTAIRDGETYALYFEGEAMIKQIFKEAGGTLTLHSRNPKYRDKTIQANDTFKILGRVRYRSG